MKKPFSLRKKPPLRAAAKLIAALLLLAAAGAAADTKLMVVTDLHYLEPSLYRGSGFFLQALRRGDGKATQYGEELLAALYQTVLSERSCILHHACAAPCRTPVSRTLHRPYAVGLFAVKRINCRSDNRNYLSGYLVLIVLHRRDIWRI